MDHEKYTYFSKLNISNLKYWSDLQDFKTTCIIDHSVYLKLPCTKYIARYIRTVY